MPLRATRDGRMQAGDQVSAVQCLAALRIRCHGRASCRLETRRDAGRPDLDLAGPGRKKIRSPECVCPSAAFEGLVVAERKVCEVDGIGEEGGGRRPRIGRARLSHSPIPAFPSFSLGPLWPSRFPTCPVALILSVAFRHRLARSRLVAPGPLCFLPLCTTAAAVALTRARARHGTTTDTPPDSGAFPRLTRFDGGRDGVLGSPHPATRAKTGQAAGERGGTPPASHGLTARPNDRGNETCGGKGSGRGKGALPSSDTRLGPGLVMGSSPSQYMFGGDLPLARGSAAVMTRLFVVDRQLARVPSPLSSPPPLFFLLCQRVLFPFSHPSHCFLAAVVDLVVFGCRDTRPPIAPGRQRLSSEAQCRDNQFHCSATLPAFQIETSRESGIRRHLWLLTHLCPRALRIGQTVGATPPSIPGAAQPVSGIVRSRRRERLRKRSRALSLTGISCLHTTHTSHTQHGIKGQRRWSQTAHRGDQPHR